MIIGEKISLRPILKNDLERLNKWKNDEDIFKYLGGGFMPLSSDQQEKWLDSLIDLTGINKRYIISNENNTALGLVGLYNINWIHRTCEIGIYIGEKESFGNGYGKQACQLIEKFAQEYLNIRKIKLNVVVDNDIALNMWKKLGYKKVGELIDERYIKGKYHNLIIMEKILSN